MILIINCGKECDCESAKEASALAFLRQRNAFLVRGCNQFKSFLLIFRGQMYETILELEK